MIKKTKLLILELIGERFKGFLRNRWSETQDLGSKYWSELFKGRIRQSIRTVGIKKKGSKIFNLISFLKNL